MQRQYYTHVLDEHNPAGRRSFCIINMAAVCGVLLSRRDMHALAHWQCWCDGKL